MAGPNTPPPHPEETDDPYYKAPLTSREDFISHIMDGDTYGLGWTKEPGEEKGHSQYIFRLEGVDAAERGQPVWVKDPAGPYQGPQGQRYGIEGGRDTKDRIAAFLYHNGLPKVIAHMTGVSSSKGQGDPRIVGKLSVETSPQVEDLGKLLLDKGLAYAEPDYATQEYKDSAAKAQQQGLGYWAYVNYYKDQIPKQERTEFIRRAQEPDRKPWGGNGFGPWNFSLPSPDFTEPQTYRGNMRKNFIKDSRQGPINARNAMYPPRELNDFLLGLYGAQAQYELEHFQPVDKFLDEKRMMRRDLNREMNSDD